jgi:hypothetical protein
MSKHRIKPDVLLFFDGTQSATEAFVKLISLKASVEAKETVENDGGIVYNKDVVHLDEAAGLVS